MGNHPSLEEFNANKEAFVGELRRSERLTGEDMAVTVNNAPAPEPRPTHHVAGPGEVKREESDGNVRD